MEVINWRRCPTEVKHGTAAAKFVVLMPEPGGGGGGGNAVEDKFRCEYNEGGYEGNWNGCEGSEGCGCGCN